MPRTWFCSLLVLCLVGCGGSPRAPVEDRNRPADTSRPLVVQSNKTAGPGEYYVRRGDTLYSIAWRRGLDFRGLAAANSIPAPYTIYPGQKLQLREGRIPAVTSTSPPATSTSPPATKTPSSANSASSSSSQKSTPQAQPVTKPSSRSGTPVSSKPVPKAAPPSKVVSAWRWPTNGKIVRSFSGTVHKGIDIGGERGEAVNAVADGVVVYSGTGIAGFGELLIVKHNNTYLSAYGHNERLLVNEGSAVRAGQKIAEKGSSGTDTVKLHFEIRKEGKPIDPLRLLPKR